MKKELKEIRKTMSEQNKTLGAEYLYSIEIKLVLFELECSKFKM